MSIEKDLMMEILPILRYFLYSGSLSFTATRRLRNLINIIEHEGYLSDKNIELLNNELLRLRRRGLRIPEELQEKLQLLMKEKEEEIYNLIKKEIINLVTNKKENIKVVFFFGSGASRPDPSNIPIVNEMLGYLINNLPPTEISFANKMKEWASIEGLNIEDIITAGYLSTLLVSKPIVNKLVGEIIYREIEVQSQELREREYVFSFQELMTRVFSMISGLMAKADSNIVHNSIASLIKNYGNDKTFHYSIVTTNYDVCIEKAFEKDKLNYKYLGINSNNSNKGIPIIKIHGSINWFYCEGCQSVITYSIKELTKFQKIYPTTGSCQECGTSASLLMVPPIAYKYVMFPPLIDIWQSAMEIIEEADVIIPIGYSFSLVDDYILKMIISGMKKKNSKLIFINRSRISKNNLEERLAPYHLTISYSIIDDAINSIPKITKIFAEVLEEQKEEDILNKKK